MLTERIARRVSDRTPQQQNSRVLAFQPLMDEAQMFVLGIIIQVHFCSNQRALGSGVNRLTKPVLHSG